MIFGQRETFSAYFLGKRWSLLHQNTVERSLSFFTLRKIGPRRACKYLVSISDHTHAAWARPNTSLNLFDLIWLPYWCKRSIQTPSHYCAFSFFFFCLLSFLLLGSFLFFLFSPVRWLSPEKEQSTVFFPLMVTMVTMVPHIYLSTAFSTFLYFLCFKS